MDSYEREVYRGFTVVRADYGYVVMRDHELCGDFVTYSDALNAVDLWHKYFGDDKNDKI